MTALVGRVLMSLAILTFTLLPPIVDLGSTHVGNADWPPHARFHEVWLLITGSSIGLVSLVLLWAKGPWGTGLAAALAACVLGGFFVAAVTAGAYGGALSEPGGVAPVMGLDANLVLFTAAGLLLALGWLLARPRRPAPS